MTSAVKLMQPTYDNKMGSVVCILNRPPPTQFDMDTAINKYILFCIMQLIPAQMVRIIGFASLYLNWIPSISFTTYFYLAHHNRIHHNNVVVMIIVLLCNTGVIS